MSSTKMFGLFIWIHDDPILGNVLNLSNITEPRKQFEDYAEGDLVKTKCPEFGIVEVLLGRLSVSLYITITFTQYNMRNINNI